MNFGTLLDASVALWPDKEALISEDERLGYAELEARTNRVANGLEALGVGAGDHVAVLVKNDVRFVETLLGALRAGASVTPATTRAHLSTLEHILRDSGAVALFASREFAEACEQLGEKIDCLQHVFLMDESRPGLTRYDAWRDAQSSKRRVAPVAAQDTAFIAYTSGSTGLPKGVVLTHATLAWSTRSVVKTLLLSPDERCLLSVPTFHANGMFGGLFSMLACGGSVVLQRDVDPVAMIEAIAREQCTYTTGVPAMYKMMLREEAALAAHDCSSLRFVICGSSEVPEDLLAEFSERMAPMLEAYGLTEGGWVCINPRWGVTKQGTTGLALPEVNLRIVDPTDPNLDRPQGEMGELLIQSPAVLVRYHNRPEVTRERLLDGGWLRTGDMVRMDEQGYVTIIGRQDDRISCAGESIYPKEVENVLMEHPNVADVAVVARPDEIKGEVPVAFVVEREPGRSKADELKQFFLSHGAPYMHPREVHVIDEMPLTAAKKVDRLALKERAALG